MQEDRDYIQREIQRLTLLLQKLIENTIGIKSDNIELTMNYIESELKNEFDLTIREISELNDSELTEKIIGINEQHLENLVELIEVLTGNLEHDLSTNIARKGIVILEYLDANSPTFSFKRMELKKTLQLNL